jgi:hypothetical protein
MLIVSPYSEPVLRDIDKLGNTLKRGRGDRGNLGPNSQPGLLHRLFLPHLNRKY